MVDALIPTLRAKARPLCSWPTSKELWALGQTTSITLDSPKVLRDPPVLVVLPDPMPFKKTEGSRSLLFYIICSLSFFMPARSTCS